MASRATGLPLYRVACGLPLVEATLEVDHVVVPLGLEAARGDGGASAARALDAERRVGRGLVEAVGQVAERDVGNARQATCRALGPAAHVDHGDVDLPHARRELGGFD